jgi:CO/xanthine dehydrogenase Mo-binding subunit
MNLDEFELPEGNIPQTVLYGVTVRSTVPLGAIKSIHLPKLPARYTAVHAKDIPGENALRVYKSTMPYLASDRVEFLGQPVLLLAGPNETVVRRLASKTVLEYAAADEAAKVFSTDGVKPFDENYEFTRGDCNDGFKRAEKIIEGEYTTEALKGSHPRPLSSLAVWQGNTLVVCCGSGHPYLTQSSIAALLSIPQRRVRVIVPSHMEDPTGEIVVHTLLAGYVSLLALLTKQAVKMDYSWQESIERAPRRHPCVIRCRTGIDREGRILAMEVNIEMDGGAYGLLSAQALQRAAIASAGGYACENIRVSSRLFRTRHTDYYGSAGLGEPQAFFAAELHSARVAEAAGLDLVSWKKQNAVNSGEPFALGGRLKESDDPLLVLDDVIKRSDFVRKNGAYEASKKRREDIFSSATPLRGIGLALCFHGVGALGCYEREEPGSVRVQLGTNKRVYIMSSVATAESRATYQTLAANILNIPVSDVIVERVDTAMVPNSGPSVGSRWSVPIGKMIQECCQSLSTKRLKSTPPITVRKTYRLPDKLTWSKENLKADPYRALCWEATVVEVEVDPVTLEPLCNGIWVSLDCGKLLSQNLFRAKAEGAVIMELASAVTREKTADVKPPFQAYLAFADYRLIPKAQINFVETEDPEGPDGMKGMGDHAVIGIAPAFVLAVSQAVGYPFDGLPLTPESIQGRLNQ